MNVTQLTQHALPTILELGKTPLLIGPHGAGKTSVIYNYAKQNGYELVILRLGQMADAGDIKGLPEFLRDENGQAISTKFITPDFFLKKGKCIIFLDEVNRCQNDLIQPIFQLIEKERKLGDLEFHPETRVIAAANPPTDDYTVLDFRDDKAFQSRFCHIYFEPTTEEFLNYLKDQGRSQVYIDFLRENPNHIRGKVKDFQIDYMSPDNRAHDECAKFFELATANNVPKGVITEVLKGMVGTASALAFVKFSDSYYSFVKGIDILNQYDKVKSRVDVDRVDSVHATSQEIVELIKDDTFELKKKHYVNLRNYMMTLKAESTRALYQDVFKVGRFFNTKWAKPEFFDNDEFFLDLKAKIDRSALVKEVESQEQE